MKNPLAKMGWALLGILSALEIRVLDALIRKGGVWLASKIDPWPMAISSIAFVMTIVVMLSISAFRRTGGMAGVGMAWASYFFGGWVWVYGFLLTYALWGVFGVLVTITRAINSPLKRVKFPALKMRSLLGIFAVRRVCRRSTSPCQGPGLGRTDDYGNVVDERSELAALFPA